jgi:hypothetical protein
MNEIESNSIRRSLSKAEKISTGICEWLPKIPVHCMLKMVLIGIGSYLVFQVALNFKLSHENVLKAPKYTSFRNHYRVSTTEREKTESIEARLKFERTVDEIVQMKKLFVTNDIVQKACQMKDTPSIDIDYNNIYWQRFLSSNGTFYLYNAFYDYRSVIPSYPSIRILSMVNRVTPIPVYCRITFQDEPIPLVVEANYRYIWDKKWGKHKDGMLEPFLISCPFHSTYLQPKFVSLLEKNCSNLTTQLAIVDNKPFHGRKKSFAVCVKGLEFSEENITIRLIEWIELMHLLGADKIFFYSFDIHPNISKTLKYYQEKKFIDVTELSLPGSQPNSPEARRKYLKNETFERRRNEVIPYNDCMYRNMNTYQYVTLLDIDEVIMPLQHYTWSEMMEAFKKSTVESNETYGAFTFRNIYFLDDLLALNQTDAHDQLSDLIDIPQHMHMLRHVRRSSHHTKPGLFIKSFFNTDNVITIHNHYPFSCFLGCEGLEINITLAHLAHYRQDCAKTLEKTCIEEHRSNRTRDTTIWRYKHNLIKRTSEVLRRLNFTS